MAPSASVQEHIDVISQVIALVDYTADVRTVRLTTEKMRQREATREKELEESRVMLRALARQFESAKAAATRPNTVPSQQAHSESLIAADAAKFGLAKSIKDEEGNVSSKEAEVARLKEELNKLEAWDVEGSWEVGPHAMRLKICKDLGFEFVPNTDLRMIVRSDTDGTVYSVDCDERSLSVADVNEFWRLSGST